MRNDNSSHKKNNEPGSSPALTIANDNIPASGILKTVDGFRVNLAIGILTLSVCVILLYLLNYLIYTFYTPDINVILDKVVPLTISPRDWFEPEPVERLQYQLSLFCFPIIILAAWAVINKKREFFISKPLVPLWINISGGIIFLVFVLGMMQQPLVNIKNETTAFIFSNNLVGALTPIVTLPLYALCIYLFVIYKKNIEKPRINKIIGIVCFAIVALVIVDIVFYNVLNLPMLDEGNTVEANAAFYSVTQVYAGKSLLVDFNAQYGLYAWLLCPLFKVIGLSTWKFGLVMGCLDAASFLFFFLGIKKIIKNDIISLITFLSLVFGIFWQTRLPFGEVPREYYQYCPIRILFPSMAFYLFVTFQYCSQNLKKMILPVLAIISSFGMLWNLDSGLVVFGAVLIGLVFSTLNAPSVKDTIKRSLVYGLWMFGALLLVVTVFFVSTKLHSGSWPDFARFSQFQKFFYISGFFMLPMCAYHFWNIPALVYFAGSIYCVFNMRKVDRDEDAPVIAFLVVFGAGIFSYFQGRSYDTNLDAVIYAAIIILGIFCDKLSLRINMDEIKQSGIKNMANESVILFLVLFLFLADSALSILYYTPSITSYAINYANTKNELSEKFMNQRIGFINKNIPKKATVLILSRNFDSYMYASGGYLDPVNLAGSSEVGLISEMDTLFNAIKTAKYPIVYDVMRPWMPWYVKDTIVQLLAQYTTIQKESPEHTILICMPGKKQTPGLLPPDANTIYYNRLGEFNKFATHNPKLTFNDNFTIEFIATLDATKLTKDNLLIGNVSEQVPFCGTFMQQSGDDLTQYKFTYGDGKTWCPGVLCKLSCTGENHVSIRVQKNIITVYNNNTLCGEANTNSIIKNSDGPVFIDDNFAGKVSEMRVDNL